MGKFEKGMDRYHMNNITKEPDTCRYLPVKDASDNLILDDSQMSNTFNEYFVNVADKIIKTITLTPNSSMIFLLTSYESSLYL